MDFATVEAASQFIKIVSTVCPCTTTDRVPRTNRGRPQPVLTSAPSSRPRPTPRGGKKPTTARPKQLAGKQTDPGSVASVGSDDSHTLPSGGSDPPPEVIALQPTCDQRFSSFIQPPTPSQNDTSLSAIPGFFPPSQVFLPSTPIPSSSQMLPPTAPITPQLAPLTGTQPPSVQPDAFFETLMQSPALYNLSKPQLEAIVAQVIREEGFIKLVCAYIRRWCVFCFLTFPCM